PPCAAFAVSSLHPQGFEGDADSLRGRPACRRSVWPDRPAGHGSGDSALDHRSAKAVLQPVLSSPLSDRPSLHAEYHVGHGGGCQQALAPGRGGRACLTLLVCAPRFFSTATAPSAKRSAT